MDLLSYRCVSLFSVLVANRFSLHKNLTEFLPLFSIRKDGSSFRDLLHVSPIRDASGKVRLHLPQDFPEITVFLVN